MRVYGDCIRLITAGTQVVAGSAEISGIDRASRQHIQLARALAMAGDSTGRPKGIPGFLWLMEGR